MPYCDICQGAHDHPGSCARTSLDLGPPDVISEESAARIREWQRQDREKQRARDRAEERLFRRARPTVARSGGLVR